MGPNIRALGASGGRSRSRRRSLSRSRSRSRKLRGGQPFQNNSGAPYSGSGSSGSSMGSNIRDLGASGGRSRRRSRSRGLRRSRSRSRSRGLRRRRSRSRKLRGGQPFQNNSGAPYSGAGSSGSSMGPNIRALGASGGKRKYRKSRRGKGGSIISTAAVPFGLLGLQKWFKGAFKHEKK